MAARGACGAALCHFTVRVARAAPRRVQILEMQNLHFCKDFDMTAKPSLFADLEITAKPNLLAADVEVAAKHDR